MPGHPRLAFAQLALAGVTVLAIATSLTAAEPEIAANEQRQKIERLRDVNAEAHHNATQLQGDIDNLQAEAIDRGLLLTLDDALFATNAVGLSLPGHRRLAAVAAFLEQHPERTVSVDGYAGAGNYRYDQALSARRAEAVKAYLIRRGVAANRLTVRGQDEGPQDQDVEADQPQQRRVELIIADASSGLPE